MQAAYEQAVPLGVQPQAYLLCRMPLSDSHLPQAA